MTRYLDHARLLSFSCGGCRKKGLGLSHPDTFEAHLTFVVCQRRNHSHVVAEQSARELLRVTQSVAGARGDRRYRAMRSLAHILKERREYREAITLYQQILGDEQGGLSQKYWIYTKEDLAELFRFQENFKMESYHLCAALATAQQFWGNQAVPTLHIQDKLRISLEKRGRVIEVVWVKSICTAARPKRVKI